MSNPDSTKKNGVNPDAREGYKANISSTGLNLLSNLKIALKW
jgi:hypothetical protein